MWALTVRVSNSSKNSMLLILQHRKVWGKPPGVAKTLRERLEIMNYKDPELYYRVDIGLPPPQTKGKRDSLNKMKYLKNLKSNPEFERGARNLTLEIDFDGIAEEWHKTTGPEDFYSIAEHYGIYNDLFGDAYFIPYIYMEIGFPQGDSLEAPVYRGNIVKPAEALVEPRVLFKADSDSLWTLVLTNPDGHLTEDNMEYVHWFVGNIPGNDVSKGEVIWDYLQPFPPRGIGFQRFVFILYKQDKIIDYSSLKKKLPCLELKDRTFNTLNFYRERQDYMTPAGLSFFQSDWDSSVVETFHEKLNMNEPVFEYDHDPQYMKKQEWFPVRRAFNLYLDKYKDPRDINKRYLLKKTENLNPFERPKEPYPRGQIHAIKHYVPSWLKTVERRDSLNIGRIRDQQEDNYE